MMVRGSLLLSIIFSHLIAGTECFHPANLNSIRLKTNNARYASTETVESETKSNKLAKISTDVALNTILENMPQNEKYALLLQSYASGILENTNRSPETLKTMESLYMEMLSKSIPPSEKSSKLLVDASSAFCSSIKLGKALQLAKAGGSLRAFGAANSQLTTPTVTALETSLMSSAAIPYDDRESEILYAGILAGTSGVWALLGVLGNVNSDIAPWATLLGCVALLAGGLDVGLRSGKELRMAAAGLERLVLKDVDRENHSDGAAFLVGYLLGLPCFCFKPDVTEALKMLRDSPEALEVYRQPKAQMSSTSSGASVFGKKKVSGGGAGGVLGDLLGKLSSKTSSSSSTSGSSSKVDVKGIIGERGSGSGDSFFALPSISNSRGDAASRGDIFSLARVLVWLMAPVAAEQLKYGKLVVSDARRSSRLLAVLEAVQSVENKKSSGSGSSKSTTANADSTGTGDESSSSPGKQYELPAAGEDRTALLQWAYYEAVQLVRQYGDLLEEVKGYLGTGTSTVGECALLIEEELR